MENIDSLNITKRLAYGKEKEDQVRKCLNETKVGYNLFPANFLEDCKEKTDCWQVSGTGKQSRCAIKARATKNDILAAIRDPFYGENHADTKMGRDILYEYLLYITLSPDEKTIRVASGKKCHTIYNEMWTEWVSKKIEINNLNCTKLILKSELHPTCELWLHRDRRSGKPKILGFIPPTYLVEGKEIAYYPFTE